MKKCGVNRERAVITHNQVAEVAEPGEGALDFPAPSVAPQRSSVLGHRFAPIPAVRRDQFNPAHSQPLSQRIAVVTTIGDQAQRFLPRPPRAGSAAYADRRERRFREPRFVRGCRTKVLSQRNTLAVDHHHPLRALAPLGFSDSSAPFLAGAKLPSRKDSLHCSCFRSLSSARNARQILSQTPCSSQSRSLRQQVAGEGNSSGKSCQRAPLRRIHKMPSSTLRSEARGRPPRRREPGRGSKGRIFSHWASVNRRPYRAIGPPSALLSSFISHFRQLNYLRIQALHPVLKQPLAILSIKSSYSCEVETDLDGADDIPDTLQWWFGDGGCWRIRTYAMDHDIHAYQIGNSLQTTLELAKKNNQDNYGDVIKTQHVLHFVDCANQVELEA